MQAASDSRRYQLVDRALNWIDEYLTQFDPTRNPLQFDENKQQAMGELAMLSMYLRRSRKFNADPRPAKFLEFIHRIYQSEGFRDRLFRVEEDFFPQLLFLVILREAGILRNQFDYDVAQNLIVS